MGWKASEPAKLPELLSPECDYAGRIRKVSISPPHNLKPWKKTVEGEFISTPLLYCIGLEDWLKLVIAMPM